jgi:hypothetical protein
LTAEGSTSKGTGSISCEVEFCIFYRLSLRTLRTKDVHVQIFLQIEQMYPYILYLHSDDVSNKSEINEHYSDDGGDFWGPIRRQT